MARRPVAYVRRSSGKESPAPVTGACLWKRLSGFGGSTGDVIEQDLVMEGPAIVTIATTDAGFNADDDCGRWTNVN